MVQSLLLTTPTPTLGATLPITRPNGTVAVWEPNKIYWFRDEQADGSMLKITLIGVFQFKERVHLVRNRQANQGFIGAIFPYY